MVLDSRTCMLIRLLLDSEKISALFRIQIRIQEGKWPTMRKVKKNIANLKKLF